MDDTTGTIEAMHEDGYVLIPGVLTVPHNSGYCCNSQEVAQAREALDRLQPFGFDGSSWSDLNEPYKFDTLPPKETQILASA